jgi:AcrR family transcriptional regulator
MTDPIRQQLTTARKNQILAAAADVFAEKGFDLTTTKEIAKRAGISEGTIYNYFASKTDLLLGIFERMKAIVIQEHLPLFPEDLDLPVFIQTFLSAPLIALKQDNFTLFRIVVSEMMVNEELRVLYSRQILEPTLALAEPYLLKHLTERGRNPAEIRLIIRAISGMVMGLMIQHILGDPVLEAGWDQLPDVLTKLLLSGLERDQP